MAIRSTFHTNYFKNKSVFCVYLLFFPFSIIAGFFFPFFFFFFFWLSLFKTSSPWLLLIMPSSLNRFAKQSLDWMAVWAILVWRSQYWMRKCIFVQSAEMGVANDADPNENGLLFQRRMWHCQPMITGQRIKWEPFKGDYTSYLGIFIL